VDFGSNAGTPVVAPATGVVTLAEPLFFTGNTVVVDHGLGLYSLLAHLSKFAVTEGERVGRGPQGVARLEREHGGLGTVP
jgi:murein DD-endopeptidase MepM/ murein hydrolase activator NlpD